MMSRWSKLVLTVLAVGFLFLVSVHLSKAKDPAPLKHNPRWGEAVSGLSCSIRTDKTDYAAGEDILIDFLLRSNIEVPTTVIRPWIRMSYLGTALPLEITGPKGRCRYTGPVLTPPPPYGRSAYVELTGGEIIGASSVFDRSVRIVPKYWSMLEPGEYSVRYKFIRRRVDNEYWDDRQRKMVPITAWRGEIASNTVTVRIGQKKNED